MNRRTIELRNLIGALVGDVDYQHRLRRAFRRRRVHPTLEALAWNHTLGKPASRLEVAAEVSIEEQRKIDAERELFLSLSNEQLQELAAESQALIDKAMAMAKANALAPVAASLRSAAVDTGETSHALVPTLIDTHAARSAGRGRDCHGGASALLADTSKSADAPVDGVAAGLSTKPSADSEADGRENA